MFPESILTLEEKVKIRQEWEAFPEEKGRTP